MKAKIYLPILAGLTLLFMCGSVGLGICIRYSYYADIMHYQQDSCLIEECIEIQDICCYQCGSRFHRKTCCDPCTRYWTNTTLDVNGTIYNKLIKSEVCSLPNMACYYDNRDIYNSLTLLPLSPSDGSIVGIIILSMFLFVNLIIIVILVLCYKVDNKIEEKKDDL